MEDRRAQGTADRKQADLDHYIQKNPRLAEKVKVLEKLKAEQAKKEQETRK